MRIANGPVFPRRPRPAGQSVLGESTPAFVPASSWPTRQVMPTPPRAAATAVSRTRPRHFDQRANGLRFEAGN